MTLAEARALRDAGQLDAYERALQSLSVSSDPIVARKALAVLGLFELEQKRTDLAFATLSKAAEGNPLTAPFLRLRMVEIEEGRGNVANAAAIAAQIVATAPDSSAATAARLRLPALYAASGDAAAADASFQQAAAVPLDELTEELFADLAGKLDKAGRADLATKIRMHLLSDYAQGRFTEQTYGKLRALADSPLDQLSLDDSVALAQRLSRVDRYDQALDLLEHIQQRFPQSQLRDTYRAVRLRALFNSRRYTQILAETGKEKLGDPALILLRARAAWRADQRPEFLAGLDRLEREFPASKEATEAKILRAKYYVTDEKNYEKSIASLQSVIDGGAFGNDGEHLWNLGWTYVLWHREDDALRIFERYLAKYPDADYTSNALFWSGKIYDRRGLTAERDARFAELLASYPYSYFSYRAKELAAVFKVSAASAPTTQTVLVPAPPQFSRTTELVQAVRAGSALSAAAPPPAPAPAGSSVTAMASLPPVQPFPDLAAQLAAANEPRVAVVDELAEIGLVRDAAREMKIAAAAHPDNLGLQFKLADVYVRGGEPFKANGILQRRFREFVRHGGSDIPPRFWQILFPLNHWDAITAEAAKRNVDPYLVASIIRQESGFEPSTVSNAGAVGLMQIMPAEAAAIAVRGGLPPLTRDSLFDPSTNVAIGAAEYSQKLALMRGIQPLAIAAYNAGEDAVNRWLSQTPLDDLDLFIESIPYAETRLYVKTVTRNQHEYRRIYGRR
jgi:soluble lytic murein transglycosylase